MSRAFPSVAAVSLLIFAAVVVSLPAGADQGLDSAGPEIWVSGPEIVQLSTSVGYPDVGVDEEGRRIYVWETFGVNRGIALRRFDRDGNPLEDPRLIVDNTAAENPQRPRLAVAADGSFMVIWQSSEDLGGGAMRWIRGQLFNSSGVAIGPRQLVSSIATGPSGLLTDSDVAALRLEDGTSGGFVAVWTSENSSGSDNSGTSIQAQRVTAGGVPTGGQIEVNSITSAGQRKPAVTEMADGGFFVVWIQPYVQGRRFTAAGVSSTQFQINTAFSGIMDEPDVAIGWDGAVAVVWEDPENYANSTEIRARLYDSGLIATGADFRVNTVEMNAQDLPRVADYGPKGFLVTWESFETSAGTDENGESVQARIITGPNTFDGPQVQYNTWEPGTQGIPASHGWYGRLASGWESIGNDQDPPPGNTEHIMGRNIEHCLFCADFEWFTPGGNGSLWRWSSSVGVDP